MKYFPNTLKNPTVGQFWDHFTHFQKKKRISQRNQARIPRIPRKNS